MRAEASQPRAFRVLVADDEESLLVSLGANLELEGFEVILARNGEDALARLGETQVDLVLSDIRMPGMDGLELFRRLKKLAPGVPMVMMTAFAREDVVDEGVLEGVFAVLRKPFDIDHVLAVLLRALKKPLVVIVDDDAAVAGTTAAALRIAGLETCTAFDGITAIAILSGGGADVFVVDLVMPELDGSEVIDRLLMLNPEITVIAISGHSVAALTSRAAALGAFACMRKPVSIEELVRTITKARGEPRAARRSA